MNNVRNLTIVIPVRNDLLLSNAVKSVPLGYEIVVAMTKPTQNVIEMAEFCQKFNPHVRVVKVPEPGMSAGLNVGVANASFEKIVVLDSDCTLEPQTLEAYSQALDHHAFVRGVTYVHKAPGWASFAGLGQENLNQVFAQKAKLIGPSIAFRKSDFLLLGGYDINIKGSCDHEFALRVEDAKIKVFFASEAVLWHQPITFKIDAKAHLGYGKGMRYIDYKRGGFYGLKICLARWYPSNLWQKAVQRGITSVFRSLILGFLMLFGYFWSLAPVSKRMEGTQ